MMLVFSVFFGRLAGVPSDGVPYPVFTFCALLPWQLFAHALSESSNSLVGNQNLITKVYFPRLVVPMSAVLGGLVDFAIAFVILLGMLAFYGLVPGWQILALPAFVLLAVMTALAVGLWLSALNVQYRDVRYTINFLVQFWLFATPVAYPSSIIPAQWRVLYGLNPMVGVVEGFRWSLLGKPESPSALVFVSTIVVVTLPAHGTAVCRRCLATLPSVASIWRSAIGLALTSVTAQSVTSCPRGSQRRFGDPPNPFKATCIFGRSTTFRSRSNAAKSSASSGTTEQGRVRC
jgi:lipopolysaccharide transport system permease protein